MTIKYFKTDILVDTICDHCGVHRQETLGRLYSEEQLLCPFCGNEHTTERNQLRRTVDETEAFIDRLPNWFGGR